MAKKWNLAQEVIEPIIDGKFGESLGIYSATRRFIVGSSNYNSLDGKAIFGKLKKKTKNITKNENPKNSFHPVFFPIIHQKHVLRLYTLR